MGGIHLENCDVIAVVWVEDPREFVQFWPKLVETSTHSFLFAIYYNIEGEIQSAY